MNHKKEVSGGVFLAIGVALCLAAAYTSNLIAIPGILLIALGLVMTGLMEVFRGPY